jgi:hypothetical protein
VGGRECRLDGLLVVGPCCTSHFDRRRPLVDGRQALRRRLGVNASYLVASERVDATSLSGANIAKAMHVGRCLRQGWQRWPDHSRPSSSWTAAVSANSSLLSAVAHPPRRRHRQCCGGEGIRGPTPPQMHALLLPTRGSGLKLASLRRSRHRLRRSRSRERRRT